MEDPWIEINRKFDREKITKKGFSKITRNREILQNKWVPKVMILLKLIGIEF